MKQHKFLVACSLLGLSLILTLSSFYKPFYKSNFNNQNSNPEAFSGSEKQSQQRGKIHLATSFENDYYTRTQREGNFYIEVQSDKYTSQNNRHIPMNLSIVIDRSGSMAGDKIRNAKLAAKYIVDQMSPEDYVAIVVYDDKVDVLQASTRVLNKQSIKNKINGITDRGSTNLMGGAIEGYAQVKRNLNSNYINRVLLLSDGLANVGISEPSQIERIVRNKNKLDGISISTFGVGNDYNEDLMTAMAENGTGNYYFINNAEDISSIFRKELNGLNEVIAQNAVLKVTIPDFVSIENVYGYKYDQVGRTLTIQFHDIFSEETKGVLIKYSVEPGRTSSVNFNTALSYYDPIEETKAYLSINNSNEYTNNSNLYNEHFSDWVSTQVTLFQSNETLEKAMQEVDKGNYQEAKKMVRQNDEYIKSKPKAIQQAPEMQRASTVNASYSDKIEDVESMPAEQIKYLQKDSKSSNYMIRNKKK